MKLPVSALFMALVLCAPMAHAQPITQRVGVCDPAGNGNCVKPNSDGSINVSGGGGGGGGTVQVEDSLGTLIDPATTATDTNTSATATSTASTATNTSASAASLATIAAAIANPVVDCGTNPCTNHFALADQGRAGTAPWPVKIDQTTPGTTNNITLSTNIGTLPIVQATASVPITFTASGGPTQIIGASGSLKIYITHWDVVLSGAGTFALVTGTGTNCGTNTAYLTGASSHPLAFAANGGISSGSGIGPVLITGAGGEVCAITTGSVDSSGSIAYAQF